MSLTRAVAKGFDQPGSVARAGWLGRLSTGFLALEHRVRSRLPARGWGPWGVSPCRSSARGCRASGAGVRWSCL